MLILAVDDDPDCLNYLVSLLVRDHEVVACAGGREAIAALEARRFDLILTDLRMPAPDGLALVGVARNHAPPIPVVILTAANEARVAVEALRHGASDYLVKPVAPDEIRAAVARILTDRPEDAPTAAFGFVGGSAAMREVRRLVPLLARSTEGVLIQGETGTGKEVLARALHSAGPRATAPFVAHNMAATPGDLAESVFFGHVRGAFSGAVTDHAGLFEQAHGGTLFLDEVDSFPLPLQAKLLRALECERVRRVGSAAERPIDVRVLAASAVCLGGLVARGGFRADLYYRLRQLEVVLPPLRDRREDIPALVAHFLSELEQGAGIATKLSPAGLERLQAHDWPGNIRELRNAVRAAALLAGGGAILPGHVAGVIPHAAMRPASLAGGSVALRDVESEHIRRVLARVGGNQSEAARLLGIDRGTLVRKLKAHGLEADS